MTVFSFIGGLTLGLGMILIVNKLVKVVLDMEVYGSNKPTEVEEDWEDDTNYDWYKWDELDSRDDE